MWSEIPQNLKNLKNQKRALLLSTELRKHVSAKNIPFKRVWAVFLLFALLDVSEWLPESIAYSYSLVFFGIDMALYLMDGRKTGQVCCFIFLCIILGGEVNPSLMAWYLSWYFPDPSAQVTFAHKSFLCTEWASWDFCTD